MQIPASSRFVQLTSRIAAWLDRAQVSGQLVLSATAVAVGLGTGFGAIVFIWMLGQVSAVRDLLRHWLGSAPGLIVAMALAGFAVGWIIERFAREAKGHGVPEVMEAMVLRGGRIRPRVSLAKVIASSLTIGAGGSAGREGPIVQVGSALGSTIGQLLRFSNERIRTLVACGAAAGIAAVFNAPIAGSIFALEVILGSFTAHNFAAVVISAVSASVVTQAYLGNRPSFDVPAYPLSHPAELLIYLVLGLLAAVLAIVFIRGLYKVEDLSDAWNIPLRYKTALGMALTAVVGLLIPGEAVLGTGLPLIGDAIGSGFDFSIGLMLAILACKLLSTLFTLGTGNSGGVFAPSLFMGAMLGGIVGQAAHALWPTVAVNPGAYALVGMAATFAGAARAPMAAILIVFEMSNDYRLILPLMMASVVATLAAELMFSESIYTLKLKQKGISVRRGRVVDVLQSVRVDEVLSKPKPLAHNATLEQAEREFARQGRRTLPVVDGRARLAGVFSLADLELAVQQDLPWKTPVRQLATPLAGISLAYADEPVGEALRRMSSRGLSMLPVVSRRRPGKLEGVVRRDDILSAYDLALARRTEVEHRAEQLRARNEEHTTFVEFQLSARGWAVGKTIADVAKRLPAGCVVVSIRRKGEVLIPRGATRFQRADQVMVYARKEDLEAVRATLG